MSRVQLCSSKLRGHLSFLRSWWYIIHVQIAGFYAFTEKMMRIMRRMYKTSGCIKQSVLVIIFISVKRKLSRQQSYWQLYGGMARRRSFSDSPDWTSSFDEVSGHSYDHGCAFETDKCTWYESHEFALNFRRTAYTTGPPMGDWFQDLS